MRIDVCPPYEIFPDSTARRSIADCRSIIHAKSLPTEEIKRLWHVDVKPDERAVSGAESAEGAAASRDDYALVIERYTRPDGEFPRREIRGRGGRQTALRGRFAAGGGRKRRAGTAVRAAAQFSESGQIFRRLSDRTCRPRSARLQRGKKPQARIYEPLGYGRSGGGRGQRRRKRPGGRRTGAGKNNRLCRGQ